ncbi:endolytic transglycosylase MltG [Microbacterium sp. GXF7504]
MSDTPPTSRRAARAAQQAAGQAPAADRDASAEVLDDLFTGRATTESIGAPPPPPDRGRRRKGWIIALVVVVALVGGVAAGGLWAWNTYEDRIRAFMGWQEPQDYEAGIAEGETSVTIVSGDTGRSISTTLFNAGVTKTDKVFYDHLIETGQNPDFQPGVFRLQFKMTAEAALEALLDPANRLENTVQLREGLTLEQTLQRTADALALPLEELQAAVADPSAYGVAADSLEGWLFPATYTFGPGVTATEAVQAFVDRAVQSLDAAGVPVEERQRILTIASIIEREARSADDFYKVSRVIQNRLDQGMRLQMDSTAQYGYQELHDGTVSSSAEALEDANPWNTYVVDGLPAGPIANPGDTAIDAAMHPADGEWLYFVTVNLDTGETVFTNSYGEHEQAVAQWRAWCRDHPDSGC